MKLQNLTGFTLVELLLVVGLIAIVGASSTPFLSRFILVNNLDTTNNNLVSTIRKAQGFAMSNKSGSTWGICWINSKIRLYSGSCSLPSYNEDYAVGNVLTITGLSDTSFDQRGKPSNALSIGINSDIKTTTITVNMMGGVNSE